MFSAILSIIVSLIEKIGLAWWDRHIKQTQQANRPITNEEELSDIDRLP